MDFYQKIEEYENNDEYYSELMTIATLVNHNDHEELYILLLEAEKNNMKLYIDDTDLIEFEYDSLTISRIKMK